MVEIIHLAPGQRPPKGGLLIECKRGLPGQELIDDERGITWRIRPEEFDHALAKLAQKGARTFYVKGLNRQTG